MANADVLKKLKAEAGKNSVGTGKTLFNSLKVAYLGVPEKQHFPKLKNSDGSKKVDVEGHDVRSQQSEGWTYTFSEIGTSNKIMVVYPKKLQLEWLEVYQVTGLGYNLRSANMIFMDEGTKIFTFK